MFRVSDLHSKDVVNSIDGKKLGYIKDIELNLTEGKIKSLVLPANKNFFGIFSKSDDIIIEWHQIQKIGIDVILVELSAFTPIGKNDEEPERHWLAHRD